MGRDHGGHLMLEIATTIVAALALPGLASEFLKILAAAQVLRSAKMAWVGDSLEWILYERGVMLEAVNVIRLERDLPLVTLAEIEKVEALATGHVDYSRKFALYCAEMALAMPPWHKKKEKSESKEKNHE
jgi:hypothetical protein